MRLRFLMPLLLLSGNLALADPPVENWYTKAFFLLHEDYHTQGTREVGRDTDPAVTRRLVHLAGPDFLQIHAKGNPGWTTYPTKIGHKPPKLRRDVLRVWRDVAQAEGIPFSAYFNLGRDGVIMKERPQWNRVHADGTPWERALCYHTGVIEEYLIPMILEILGDYQPDGFWFDGSCFTVSTCWCDACRKRFRETTGMAAPLRPSDPGWREFKEMHRQIYRECIEKVTAAIHAKDPDCLLAVNWAYAFRMPERPPEGIAYLTGDIGNRVEGLSVDGHYYDAAGLPFDLMTKLCVPTRSGDDKTVKPAHKPRVQIEQEMAVILANGGRYHLWDTPTPEGGIFEGRFQFIADVVRPFLRARQPWCEKTRRVADVALYHSVTAHYAASDSSPFCFPRRNNRLLGAADRLSRRHLDYQFLPTWRFLKDGCDAKVLIVEHPKRFDTAEKKRIVKYVKEGGTVLLTGMATAHPQLRSLMGIQETTRGPQGTEPLTVTVDEREHAFTHWLTRVTPTTAEVLMSVSDEQGRLHPLLIRNHVGRGSVFYVALPLLSDHGKEVVPADCVEAVFDHVLPRQSRTLLVDAPETARVIHRRAGNRHILHVVNMAPGTREIIQQGQRREPRITSIPAIERCTLRLVLSTKPTSVRLQPGNRDVEWEYSEGRVNVSLPRVEVHEMVVVGDFTSASIFRDSHSDGGTP